MSNQYIRNFSIIAHIDHGKSTLADRFLEKTAAISKRNMHDQYLDTLDIEKKRGITIKAQTVKLTYKLNKKTYKLNLIDTPGHVDFRYEVSRALAACEGAILLIDATQGVEAQTVANLNLALKNNLTIIPVLNKIDMVNADPDRVKIEIEKILNLSTLDILQISGKTGEGVDLLLKRIISVIPPPKDKSNSPLQALVFDAWFDAYKGIVLMIRVFQGSLSLGDKIKTFYNNFNFKVNSIGFFSPNKQSLSNIESGDVGFVVTNIKTLTEHYVGDTLVKYSDTLTSPLDGFKEITPIVFAGFFPIDNTKFNVLSDSLIKLSLNDSAMKFSVEKSQTLGLGFRCGFLGLLHMEIVQERLESEFNIDLIITVPTVVYKIVLHNGEISYVKNPIDLPDQNKIISYEEPYILANIHVPDRYLGEIIKLCTNKRGVQIDMRYISDMQVFISYEMPLSETIWDFFGEIKSLSKGFASYDYELIDYRETNVVKMNVLINDEVIPSLSLLCHENSALIQGKEISKKLKATLPRKQIAIKIQITMNGKVISRENISALRKNVTAKCYGGDVSRKKKLLKKQKEGKKKMLQIGKIDIPKSIFFNLLKAN